MEWSLNENGKKRGRMWNRKMVPIVSCALYAIMSCNDNPAAVKKPTGTEFYYFPARNVYYNPLKKEFFYSLNAGKSWSSFTSVNGPQTITAGRKVVLISDNDEIYRDNATHRKLYAGKLFDIADSSTTASPPGPEVMERKVAVKKRRTTAAKNETDDANSGKTGIGKFIRKIFGKHK